MNSKGKINVLIAAHEFSPYQGSECAVGWNIVLNLAKDKEIYLHVFYATGPPSGENAYLNAVTNFFVENDLPENLKLIPVSQPSITLFINRVNCFFFRKLGVIGFPIFYYWGYSFWQKKVYDLAKKYMIEHEINITHNLTQISFRNPGYFWRMDVPFVWGPIGGLDSVPFSFLRHLPLKSKILELIRYVSNYFQFNYKISVRKSLNRSAIIYAISSEIFSIVSRINDNVVNLLESAATTPLSTPRVFKTNEKLEIVWIGSLIRLKSLSILLHALKKIPNVNNKVNVKVIGSGPLYNELLKTCKSLGLDCIIFIGQIKHKEVKGFLEKAHLLLHTSYKEGTPAVVLESLSNGLPVMCHDISGIAVAVTDKCGIKIPLVDFNNSINAFSENLKLILKNPEIIERLSKGALRRREELTWLKSAQIISSNYKKIYNYKSE